MAAYLDNLSESLVVLQDLLESEEGQHTTALAASTRSLHPDSTQLVQELSKALESRAVIDQAKGMLMTRMSYDAEEAFDLMKIVSKDSNEKMIIVAQRMVDSVVKARQN
jgi:AmiR/NasT family two-component response regulator